jgi:alpha-D-xyloside xylohydrolase
MAESLRGGLSLGLSGFGFWSHDIGGFEGLPNAELYKRWIAFGLLSSHSRLHGSSSYRVPWLFDEQAVDVLRRFTKLKCKLMPYLYAQAIETARRGLPLMRAMLLEFPEDPTCDYLDRQYMLGERLLAAPVFAADGAVTYYVPAGRWTHVLTGATVEGPGWVRETHDVMSMPLLVRPHSAIAVGARDDRPDYDYADGVTLQLYALAEGQPITVAIPTTAGDTDATLTVLREDRTISVTRDGASKPWSVALVGVAAVASVVGGAAESGPQGVIVRPDQGAERLSISLGAGG